MFHKLPKNPWKNHQPDFEKMLDTFLFQFVKVVLMLTLSILFQ